MSRIIKISADDVSKLRGCDVYRVLTQGVGGDEDLRGDVAAHVINERPDLVTEVMDALTEIRLDEEDLQDKR